MPWIVVSLNAKDFASLRGLFCHWNLTFLFLRKAFSNIDKNNWWNIWHFKCFCWAQISNRDIVFFRFFIMSIWFNWLHMLNIIYLVCHTIYHARDCIENHFKLQVIIIYFNLIMKHKISFSCELMVFTGTGCSECIKQYVIIW